eukprot:4884016-Pleurochrysis_carterae.AAC.3
MDSSVDDEAGGGSFRTGQKEGHMATMPQREIRVQNDDGEYNRVANKQVPITQAGWTVDRTAAEHSLTVGIIEESVNHKVQWEIEEAMGVPDTIVSIMKALREGTGKNGGCLTGRYETAYGTTDPVEIQKGLGQGDLLSLVRSKLILAVIQRAMHRLVPGIEFNQKGSRDAPFLI